MKDIVATIREMAHARGRSLDGVEFPDAIRLEPGALRQAAEYIKNGPYRRIVLAADDRTFEAAGKRLADELEAVGLQAAVTEIRPNGIGDVVADEASIVQVLLDVQRTGADLLLAVGAGTIHDITRYAAYTSGLPFISVPTAPSVDGFTSKGAPLLIRGEKITVPAVGPKAIFADTGILKQAPAPMVAAGFGDMLGKYTSLFDWTFGRMTAGEPYDSFAAELTGQALEACVSHADSIGNRTEEGIAVLTEALLLSGLAMLIFGQSHPASGAEHHLSHYWEMTFIREGRKQLLHGAKVGVACSVVAGLYKRIGEEGLPAPQADGGGEGGQPASELAAADRWPEIRELIRALPDETRIREWLCAAQGPSTLEELGIDEALLARSLREADRVRPGRSTLLRAYNAASGRRH